MNRKTKITIISAAVAAAVCLSAVAGFLLGRDSAFRTAKDESGFIQKLNRDSILGMNAKDEKIYVIGHRSPDSDTVCSAIAYARLLVILGFDAEAAISEPVNNETSFILKEAGVQEPDVLGDAAGKNIFLVDHSEYAQAVTGMEEANIVGVLDHHGIGSVSTGGQIFYEARPIGASATIVWLDYLNYGADIDKTTAYLLLAAVISDTNYLTGTTTTDADREAISALSKLSGVTDTESLYRTMHEIQLSYGEMSSEEILFSDYKEYESSGYKYGIGLVNAIDEDTARELAGRMKEVLPGCMEGKDVDMMFASVGIRENGEKIDFIVPGHSLSEEMIKTVFPQYDEYDGTSYIYRTGLGRKTKFVPGMTEYLAANPKE